MDDVLRHIRYVVTSPAAVAHTYSLSWVCMFVCVCVVWVLLCVLCLWVYCSGVVCFVASSCAMSLHPKYPATHLCASDSSDAI